MIAWFEADSENSAGDAKGVGALPNGEAYYSAALMRRTTLPVTAIELHQTGLAEVERLRAEMEAIKAQVDFEGSLDDFFHFIKTDKQFYYANDEEGRQGYIDETTKYLNYINDRLPEYFGILPKADGSRPGVYYVHLSDMNAKSITALETTAYHEGNPGHHMETSISQELTGIPTFRTQAFFNSYSEGWASYVLQSRDA